MHIYIHTYRRSLAHHPSVFTFTGYTNTKTKTKANSNSSNIKHNHRQQGHRQRSHDLSLKSNESNLNFQALHFAWYLYTY